MNDEKLASAYRLTEPRSPHVTEETWEALADGTLSASERDIALEHVTRCESCATVYRGLAMFERESRAFGAPVQPESRFRAALGSWPASIAAVLVIGATAGLLSLLYRNPRLGVINTLTPASTTTELRASPIEPLAVRVAESRALIYRRQGETSQPFLEAFDRAIEPYRQGRFAEAVGSLAALGQTFPDAPEPPLYEGVAQLLSGHAGAAIGALDRAAQLAKESEWRPDAEYYGARARLAAGREEGRPTLVRLCETPGPYQAQSCRALGMAPSLSVR